MEHDALTKGVEMDNFLLILKFVGRREEEKDG